MASYSNVRHWLKQADAVICTVGNQFAVEEGLALLSKNFVTDYPLWAEKTHASSLAQALDYHWDQRVDQWLFWSHLIQDYSVNYQPGITMQALQKLLAHREFFIVTSTFGHFFETAGFLDTQLFNLFGDWTQMQCSSGLDHGRYDDRETVKQFLLAEPKGLTSDLVPKCRLCQAPMEVHLPLNSHFFPDTQANSRLRWFITNHEEKKVVVLALGVDETSPQLLTPMAQLVSQFPSWHYVATDFTTDDLPALNGRGVGLAASAQEVLLRLSK